MTTTAPTDTQLHWRPGQDDLAGVELAEIAVPLDYSDPDSIPLTIGLARIQGTARNRGTLIVGPGDDLGNRGIPLVGHVHRRLPASLRARFDVVGFDHRFMGSSSPLDVQLTPEERFWVFHQPQSAATEHTFQRSIADKMHASAGSLLPHATTHNVAHDLETIRLALGVEKVTYLGYSYATYVGAVYRSLYPQHCAAVILDSPCSPDWLWRGLFTDFPPNGERSLDRFSAWAADHQERYHLGADSTACRNVINALFRRAARGGASLQGMPVNKTLLTLITVGCLHSEANYPAYASIITHLTNGTPLSLQAMRYLQMLFQSPKEETGTVAQIAILAGDVDWPTDPSLYEREAQAAADQFPIFGGAMHSIKVPAFMTDYPKPPPPDLSVGQDVPTLVVSSSDDMSTPLSAAKTMSEALGNAELLVAEGMAQHRVFPFRHSDQVTPKICDFLIQTRHAST